jgi:hypothetical protein
MPKQSTLSLSHHGTPYPARKPRVSTPSDSPSGNLPPRSRWSLSQPSVVKSGLGIYLPIPLRPYTVPFHPANLLVTSRVASNRPSSNHAVRCNPHIPNRPRSRGAARSPASSLVVPRPTTFDHHCRSDALGAGVHLAECADYGADVAAYFDGAVELE